jgi:toxin FitB
MKTLLDTCVISEFTRSRPAEQVIQWMDSIEEDHLFLSAITVGEVQRGIERLPESGRKNQLKLWLADEFVGRFGARILPLDIETMLIWGTLTAGLEAAGNPLPVMDSLILASALRHKLAIATRNPADFPFCGVQIIDPWE